MLTLCVELDFRHILKECVVNKAQDETLSDGSAKCMFVSIVSFLSSPQEPVLNVGKVCMGRITPARLRRTSITPAASPACPVVSTPSL